MPDDTRTKKIKLAKPVDAYGEKIAEVAIRPPTVKELRECGQPYALVASGGGGVIADYLACARLLTRVCTPPLPGDTVDDLDIADFDEMAMILVGFTKRAPQAASANGKPPSKA